MHSLGAHEFPSSVRTVSAKAAAIFRPLLLASIDCTRQTGLGPRSPIIVQVYLGEILSVRIHFSVSTAKALLYNIDNVTESMK